MERELPQPDSNQVPYRLKHTADHCERCEKNLPAVDGGARLAEKMDMIFDRLTAMDNRFTAMETAMEDRFTAMEDRLTTLEHTVQRGSSDTDRRIDGLERMVVAT